MKPKISIIVPVYNIEKYLDQCIKSIVNQLFDEFELILVDDGSTDASYKICNLWKEKDPRIKVIHKKNAGPQSAVLTGINEAQADVIGFVDGDDYVMPDYFRTLYEAMIVYNADCVNCKWTLCFGQEEEISYLKDYILHVYDKNQIETSILWPFWEIDGNLYKNWSNPRWNKLYKKKLLEKVVPLLEDNVRIGEDAELNLHYLTFCDKVIDLKGYGGYIHRMNERSVTMLFDLFLVDKNLRYLNVLKSIACQQGRLFNSYSVLNDDIMKGLLWQALSSENSIEDKIQSYKKIYEKIFDKKNISKKKNIFVRFCFWLLKNDLMWIGISCLSIYYKIIKKIMRN